MKQCLKYLQEHFSKGIHSNYNLEQVCKAINKIADGSPAKFYEKISKAEIQKIAELKMPDLNAASLEAAMSMIAGTARSMGITVEE